MKFNNFFFLLLNFIFIKLSGRHSVDLSESPTKLLIKSRNGKPSHYNDFIGMSNNGGKYNGNIISSDRSPNGMSSSSKKSSSGGSGSKFYGDFLTLTPRRNKMNEYLQYQQQSHEPYDHMAGRKQQHNYNNYYQNHLHSSGRDEESYLHSLDTLKLDDEHNILHSKLFYQPTSENSGNEYVISGNNNNNINNNNNNPMKKHHVVTTKVHNSNNPNNIVSPPNQFDDNSSNNINRFIKL